MTFYPTAAIAQAEAAIRHTGRSCGSCSMCCKLLKIDSPELTKPADTWCRHCRPGRGGCRIYSTRPSLCASYACAWLVNREFGDEWKPDRAKIVVSVVLDAAGRAYFDFSVDPAVPDRWREATYYTTIKDIALRGLLGSHGQTFTTRVQGGKHSTLVLSDKDVDISENPYLVLQTGVAVWDVLLFKTEADGAAFFDQMDDIIARVRSMAPDQRLHLLGQLRALMTG